MRKVVEYSGRTIDTFIKDKAALCVLSSMGIETVQGLMRCPLGRLMVRPELLGVWEDIVHVAILGQMYYKQGIID